LHPCRYNGVEKFMRQNPDVNAEVRCAGWAALPCWPFVYYAAVNPLSFLPAAHFRSTVILASPPMSANCLLLQVLDIEDLGRIGESRSVCPYFLARWAG